MESVILYTSIFYEFPQIDVFVTHPNTHSPDEKSIWRSILWPFRLSLAQIRE